MSVVDVSEFVGTSVDDTEKQAVWAILQSHVGKENAITSDAIAAMLGQNEDWDSNPQTRKIVRSLIYRDRKPIGSGPNGYYIISNRDELQDIASRENQRKAKIDFKLDSLVEGYHDFHGDDQ